MLRGISYHWSSLLGSPSCSHLLPLGHLEHRCGMGTYKPIRPRKEIDLKKLLMEDEKAEEVYSILKNMGYGDGEITRVPNVLSMAPSAVINYAAIMQESLFRTITLSHIPRLPLIHRTGLNILQSKDLLPSTSQLLNNYFNVLELPKGSPVRDKVMDSIPSDTERFTLGDLRQTVIGQFLTWKLETEWSKVQTIFPRYPRISYRCMDWIKRTHRVLTSDLVGFDNDKLLRHPYLLQLSPDAIVDFFKSVETLVGIPIKQLIHLRPKIIMSPKNRLLEIDRLFKEHGISADTTLRHPEVLTLSLDTLRQRLGDFDKIPELRPLKNHPRMIRLIYYYNKTKRRVDYLRSVNITGASLHLLSCDKDMFDAHVEAGDIRTIGRDTVLFIKHCLASQGLKISSQTIRKNLSRHPHWLQAVLSNVKDNWNLLQGLQAFSPEQLVSAMPLLLYPNKKVEEEITNVINSGEAKLTDPYFLHMVLYFLEKPLHFSGDGIWPAASGDGKEKENAGDVDDGHHDGYESDDEEGVVEDKCQKTEEIDEEDELEQIELTFPSSS